MYERHPRAAGFDPEQRLPAAPVGRFSCGNRPASDRKPVRCRVCRSIGARGEEVVPERVRTTHLRYGAVIHHKITFRGSYNGTGLIVTEQYLAALRLAIRGNSVMGATVRQSVATPRTAHCLRVRRIAPLRPPDRAVSAAPRPPCNRSRGRRAAIGRHRAIARPTEA